MAETGDSEAGAASCDGAASPAGAAPADGETMVRLLLHPIGSADILKTNRFKQKGSVQFRQVQLFLRKKLNMKASDSLFCYCRSAFAPAPDQTLADLYKHFGTGKELIIQYSPKEAWG